MDHKAGGSFRHKSQTDTLRWWKLGNLTTVAPLLRGNRRGIYVLEFSDSSRYVGQATDATKRFATHRHGSRHHRPWTDITAFGFLSLPYGNLDQAERNMIQQQKNAGFHLRNKTFNYEHWEPCPLDQIIPTAIQRHWATDTTKLHLEAICKAASRPIKNSPKLTQRRRGTELIGGERVCDRVIDILANVVAFAVPEPHLTEESYWTLSDFPSTAGGRFATLNVGSLELLYFSRTRDVWQGLSSCGTISLNAAPETFVSPNPSNEKLLQASCFTGEFENLPFEIAFLPSGEQYYGVPVDTICAPLESNILDDLSDDEQLGVRQLALTAMRRGSARLNARSHSRDLTTLVYRRIAELAA